MLRRRLGPFFVAGVLGLASFLIYRALTRYSLDEIITSVTSIPIDHIVRMGAFSAGSYCVSPASTLWACATSVVTCHTRGWH